MANFYGQYIGFGAGGEPPALPPTGGTIATSGDYKYHTFTSSGTFAITSLSPFVGGSHADFLVIAGGGGGAAGGGGAGGLRQLSSQAVTTADYTVTIGAGQGYLTSGIDSSVSGSGLTTITATGGGSSVEGTPGRSGGSGGGGGNSVSTQGGAGNAGGYSPVEGYAGGGGAAAGGGGGGGAGQVGGNCDAVANTGGAGGNGLSTYSSWGSATSTGQNIGGTYWYAGGGGGGRGTGTAGSAGNGGGGVGRLYSSGTPNTDATANTGGGAGRSGTGGSGLVIVRWQFQ